MVSQALHRAAGSRAVLRPRLEEAGRSRVTGAVPPGPGIAFALPETGSAAVVQILIVDDHPLFREALRGAVSAVLDGAEVEEADGIEAACRVLERQRNLDLALLDLGMPGVSGFEGLIALRTRFPRVPVVIVSALDDPRVMEEAIRLGAAGFVPKTIDRPLLAQALQTVLHGEVYLPVADLRAGTVKEDGLAARLAELTPQQLRVLQMIRQGLLNKQIAHELKIGETTVKAHVSEVLRKLKVVSRTQAVIETAKLDLPALMARGPKAEGG
jgi:DNA-binding NarL/FixJ family response regulator